MLILYKIQMIKLILVLIFCIIIFVFSNTNSNESNKQSKGIIKEIVVKIYEIKQYIKINPGAIPGTYVYVS